MADNLSPEQEKVAKIIGYSVLGWILFLAMTGLTVLFFRMLF